MNYNMRNPLVSLIIPVYNVQDYLEECLESAITQSYVNMEIILVDDGSTDECGRICEKYKEKDTRVKVFHIENRGLSFARNYGIDHVSADSKYIAFLDADDWLESNAIQRLCQAGEVNNADVISCLYSYEMNKKKIIPHSLEREIILKDQQVLDAFVENEYIGNLAWNKLYRKELFNEVRYPVGKAFEDIATTYKILLKVEKLVIVPELLIHYRIRENSLSRNYSMKSLIDYWQAYYEKYVELSVLKYTYKKPLIKDCLKAVNRTCRGYAGCTEDEKVVGVLMMRQIKEFAVSHKQEIIFGDYSFSQKITCLLALQQNWLVLVMLNRTYRVMRFLRRNRRYE